MAGDKKSDDQWVMSTPTDKKVSDFLVGDNLDDEIFGDGDKDDTSLEKELEHWGMDIPPVLLNGDSDSQQEFNDNEDFKDIEIPGVIDNDLDFLGSENDFDEVLSNIDEIDSPMDLADEGSETDLVDTNDSSTLEESDHQHTIESENQHQRPQKGSILDHLGENFFDDESDDNEHSLSSLVGDMEEGETREIDSNLKELSSALSGESSSAPESADDEELFPDSSDLEYPDMGEMSAGSEGSEDETLLPGSDDLEYPDLLSMSSEEGASKLDNNESKPQLTPAEELSPNDDEDVVEQTDPSFNITQELKNDLEREIENDDVDPNDFWATDDFPKIKKTLEKPITEVQASKQIKEDFFKDIDDEDNFKIIPSKRFSSISLDEVSAPNTKTQGTAVFDKEAEERIIESVKEALAPKIEKIVRDLFAEKIEKVAWEVIPDLAENIIKSEVEEIAKQVYLSKDSTDK